MKVRTHHVVVAAALIGVTIPMSTVHAQLGNLLNQGNNGSSPSLGGLTGGSSSGGLGDLGSALSGGSVTSGNSSNVAGVLQFCIKNNYLGGKRFADEQAARRRVEFQRRLHRRRQRHSGYR
jgi:hypothetical protein